MKDNDALVFLAESRKSRDFLGTSRNYFSRIRRCIWLAAETAPGSR